MKKEIIICVLGLIIMTSCSSKTTEKEVTNESKLIKSEIIDLESLKHEKVIHPGVGLGNLIIGKTKYDEIIKNVNDREMYTKEGFEFQFDEGNILEYIILENVRDYLSESGEVFGKSKNEIIHVLGDPDTSNISVTKGKTQIGQIRSMKYNGLTFLLEDTLVKVIIIAKKLK